MRTTFDLAKALILKVFPKKKIEEDGDIITYEQYLMLHNLRDFTKNK